MKGLRYHFQMLEFLYLLFWTTLLQNVALSQSDKTAGSSAFVGLNPGVPISKTTFDPASLQLGDWAAHHSLESAGSVRDDHGCPVPSLTASLGIGSRGDLLLQDVFLVNEQAAFSRERIPERPVHSKGHGAFGYFEVTHDISSLTKADFLNGIGKKTPILVRFSVVGGASGSTDMVREGRGFAIKFYTGDGNYDMAGCAVPAFPIRDPMLFTDLNRSRKRNPRTNLVDFTMQWDFSSLRPETVLSLLLVASDFGSNSRVISGFGIHAFKFVNKEGVPVFVKLHFLSNQPFTWFNSTELELISGMDPDYATRDLFNAIANKDYPSWTMKIQVMTLEQALKYPVDPFDSTKIWREEDFPLIPVGKFVLNKNPENYFTDIEQAAFCPARLVPGIEASPDRLLHARMFSYADSQRYRLGVNFAQLEVNRPKFKVNNYIRDGFMRENPNGAGSPNYFPNSFNGPTQNGSAMEHIFHVSGIVDRYDTVYDVRDNFNQARLYLYKDLTKNQRIRVAQNLAGTLAKAIKEVRERAVHNLFYPITKEFGDLVWGFMQDAVSEMEKNNS